MSKYDYRDHVTLCSAMEQEECAGYQESDDPDIQGCIYGQEEDYGGSVRYCEWGGEAQDEN